MTKINKLLTRKVSFKNSNKNRRKKSKDRRGPNGRLKTRRRVKIRRLEGRVTGGRLTEEEEVKEDYQAQKQQHFALAN